MHTTKMMDWSLLNFQDENHQFPADSKRDFKSKTILNFATFPITMPHRKDFVCKHDPAFASTPVALSVTFAKALLIFFLRSHQGRRKKSAINHVESSCNQLMISAKTFSLTAISNRPNLTCTRFFFVYW